MTGRTPTLADAAAIAALLNELAAAGGIGWTDEDEVRSWLTMPDSSPENARVFEADGALTGYADLYRPAPERAWLDVRARTEAAESEAVEWGEERARELGCAVVRGQAAPDSALARTLSARGYRPVRHSFRMRRALDDEPPPPDWPAGIEVRTMRPGEERAVHAADQEAFADHYEFEPQDFEHWHHHVTSAGFDPSLWFLAVDGAEIAGICLCFENERTGGPTGWVGHLAVRPPWRRRGLGRALLLHAFRALRARGLPVAALGVDGENTTGAVRLYERAGMEVAARLDTLELRL